MKRQADGALNGLDKSKSAITVVVGAGAASTADGASVAMTANHPIQLSGDET
jgi:hypothetical protein